MVRKLKVTKRVAAKVPWYERPVLLFGGIAVVLLASGILMANVTSRSARTPTLGQAAGEATVGTPAGGVTGTAGAEALLAPNAALPAIQSGECAPPMAVETRQDAVAARARMREARGLAAQTTAAGNDAAGFAVVAVEDLVARAAQTSDPAQLWGLLELKSGFDPFTDIELQRDAQGCTYVAGFISREVGEALARLGPGLALAPAPVVAKPPFWQFWKKPPKPDTSALYRGSVVAVYSDLNPEAECFVVLPLGRARPSGVRTPRAALERPLHVLEVTLQ